MSSGPRDCALFSRQGCPMLCDLCAVTNLVCPVLLAHFHMVILSHGQVNSCLGALPLLEGAVLFSSFCSQLEWCPPPPLASFSGPCIFLAPFISTEKPLPQVTVPQDARSQSAESAELRCLWLPEVWLLLTAATLEAMGKVGEKGRGPPERAGACVSTGFT